jgi:hypothetical protein
MEVSAAARGVQWTKVDENTFYLAQIERFRQISPFSRKLLSTPSLEGSVKE